MRLALEVKVNRLDLEDLLVKIGRSMKREGFSAHETDEFLDRALGTADDRQLLLVCLQQVEALKESLKERGIAQGSVGDGHLRDVDTLVPSEDDQDGDPKGFGHLRGESNKTEYEEGLF